MKSEHNKTLIKLREVENKFKDTKGATEDYRYFFAFPAKDFAFFHEKNDENKNLQYLRQVDKDNENLMFKEILKYNEELRLLWERGDMFQAKILQKRYAKTKAFYKILIRFLLSTLTFFYYSNHWQSVEGEEDIDALFGEESKGQEFSFDKAFEYTMQLEKTIKNEFNKIVDICYPPVTEQALVSAVVNKSQAQKVIGKEIKKHKK
jgi:hypothetical protein